MPEGNAAIREEGAPPPPSSEKREQCRRRSPAPLRPRSHRRPDPPATAARGRRRSGGRSGGRIATPPSQIETSAGPSPSPAIPRRSAATRFLSRSNNITMVRSVYCDAYSNNTISKHSFFLKGNLDSSLPRDNGLAHIGLLTTKIIMDSSHKMVNSANQYQIKENQPRFGLVNFLLLHFGTWSFVIPSIFVQRENQYGINVVFSTFWDDGYVNLVQMYENIMLFRGTYVKCL